MSKEIKDLLEELANEDNWAVRDTGFMSYMPKRDGEICIDNPWEVANQALLLLKQQPPAGDFTKEWMRKLENAVALFKMGKNPDEWFQSIVTSFREACDRLDRAEAINKDLLEACESVWNDTKGLSPSDYVKRDTFEKIKTAIAKAKEER